MMLSSIIIAFIVILAIILSFKFLKNIIQAVLVTVLLLLVVGVLVGYATVQDAQDFKQTFQTQPSTYILVHNDSVITGFQAVAFNFNNATTMSPQELSSLQNADDPSGKIFLISKQALNFSLSQDISFDELFEESSYQRKADMFKLSLFNTILSRGPFYLFKEARVGTIEILPKTFVVRGLQFAPKKAFSQATNVSLGNQSEISFNLREKLFGQQEENETVQVNESGVSGQ